MMISCRPAPLYLMVVVAIAITIPPSVAFGTQHGSVGVSSHPKRHFSTRVWASINNSNNADEDNNLKQETAKYLQDFYQQWNALTGREDKHILESRTFVVTPFVAGLLSFFMYPKTAIWFHNAVEFFSKNNFETVDGGQLQWSILLPALNGVVMTAISLLYANLISTTGTQLRERQMTIHSTLSQEMDGLRRLVHLVPYYPLDFRATFAQYVQEYLTVLVKDVDPDRQDDKRIDQLRSESPVLSAYRNGLHALSAMDDDGIIMNGNILDRSYETLDQICQARSTRIMSTQTRFPSLHYVTITTLSAVILLVFLLETDRKVILFLDKFQIRLVWGFLVGTITAIYCIGIDLTQPFIGTYTVPANQLVDEQMDLMELVDSMETSNDTVSLTTTAKTNQIPEHQVSLAYQASHQSNAPHLEESATPPYYLEESETPSTSEYAQNNNADGDMSLYEEYMRNRGNQEQTS